MNNLSNSVRTIRLLVLEDHPHFRSALRFLLEDHPDLQIAIEAETGAEALERFDPETIDLALLDIRLPDISGIEVAHQLRERQPDLPIIMLSMRDEAEIQKTLPVNTRFVSKSSDLETLPDTIRSTAAGLAS